MTGEFYILLELDDDALHYYELHGIKTFSGGLQISLSRENHRVTPKGDDDFLALDALCSWLTPDCHCAGFNNPDRPSDCHNLTKETATSGKYHITEGCIFERR